jgi:hypothetical protein
MLFCNDRFGTREIRLQDWACVCRTVIPVSGRGEAGAGEIVGEVRKREEVEEKTRNANTLEVAGARSSDQKQVK